MKKIAFFLLFAIIAAIAPLTLSAQNGVHNGHRYVDLGLPSGTKWADCNIGATSKTGYGYYYAWGETTRKTNYSWSTYKYGKDDDELTKYCTDSEYGKNGFEDGKEYLDLDDDVANKLWGGKWCTPSYEQFQELSQYTKQRWMRINGVKGMLFTGRNGRSIFLPAVGCREGTSLKNVGVDGCYWACDLRGDCPYAGNGLYIVSDGIEIRNAYESRFHGHTVRPVYDKNTLERASILKFSGTDNGHGYVDLGLPSGTKWADCNVGASSPTGYGNYYAWGETKTKSSFDGDNYKVKKYNENDGKTELDLEDDVAHTQWGGKWRIPSIKHFRELIKFTKHKWTAINGVKGLLFTGKNGNSIFLPAAGLNGNGNSELLGGSYGSSSLIEDSEEEYEIIYALTFDSESLNTQPYWIYDLGYPSGYYRQEGHTIRAVYESNTSETSTVSLKNSGTNNGHSYVDLGLPSGTKWADCNVGASSPTDNGDYYAWGETSQSTNGLGWLYFDWDVYKYGEDEHEITKYCTISQYGKNGFKDNKIELDFNDDVAHKLWGSSWRIPSNEQFKELIDNTTSKLTEKNNVSGWLFTAKNGNSIFLPAAGYRNGSVHWENGDAGYYWSRTLNSEDPSCAYILEDANVSNKGDRCDGITIRPVCK